MHNNINYIANRNHSKQYIFYPFYLRCQFEFQTNTPININFTEQWLKDHPLKCSISVKQLDRIDAPLTYGIFHPIILIHINTE